MTRPRSSLLVLTLCASALAFAGCASTADSDTAAADAQRAREEFEARTAGDDTATADAGTADAGTATADAYGEEPTPLTDTEEDMATGAGRSAVGGDPANPPNTPVAGDNDPEILGVVQSVNNGELKSSELALTKATSPEVKQFAQMMVTHHEQSYGQVQGLGLTPVSGQISQELDQKTTALMDLLQGQSGAAFDSAYIDAQVLLHQQALTVIDQQLLPGATRPEVRTLLEGTRAAVASHLQQAQQLRASLGAAGAAQQ